MFRILNTIQKKEKLNKVYAIGKKENGGAFHNYLIIDSNNDEVAKIKFQKGARNEKNSTNGVIDADLLEIVRDRLICFQSGEFKSKYNEDALYHIEKALDALNDRVEDRIRRKVLGKEEK